MRKEFSAGDGTMSAFGKVVENFVKFSYGYDSEAVKNYTGNNKLTSYSVGKENEEASLEVYMSQCREWEKHALSTTGSSKLSGLPPFPIAFNYFNDDQEEVTDVITVKILGTGREIEGGADGLKCEIKLLCLGVEIAKQ